MASTVLPITITDTIPQNIRDIIDKWLDLQVELNSVRLEFSPHYKNITYCKDALQRLQEHIKMHRQTLQTWLQENLKATKKEKWIKTGVDRGTEYVQDILNDNRHGNSLPTDYDKSWPQFYTNTPFNGFDINIQTAITSAKNAAKRFDIIYCTDEEILNMHLDIPHQDNGWFCDLCDTMELAWRDKLKTKCKDTNNIFLNTSLQKEFISLWAPHITEVPNEYETWEPMKEYGEKYDRHNKNYITHMDELKQYMDERRDTSYKIESGKTPIQHVDNILYILQSTVIGYDLGLRKGRYTEYDLFMNLWSRLDCITYPMERDLEFMEKLVALL
jgi:hypothetical protein